MENENGTVKFFGTNPTRSLLRHVQGKVERWIEREKAGPLASERADYEVQVEREDTFPYYHCAAEVKIGEWEWRSYETGRTLHEAVDRALRHLKRLTVGAA